MTQKFIGTVLVCALSLGCDEPTAPAQVVQAEDQQQENQSKNKWQMIVVQYSREGAPVLCWRLRDDNWQNAYYTHVDSEVAVRLSVMLDKFQEAGQVYAYAEVKNDDWEAPAKALGVELARCTGGQYR